jgi:hypothetical protein
MMVDDAMESLAVIYKSDEDLLVAVSYLLYHYLKNKQHVCTRVSGRLSSSCSTIGTHRVILVTNSAISRMKKGLENVYDKWNISVVICDTDVPLRKR